MRDITLGQYFPADSVIHRLDPRVKILSLIAHWHLWRQSFF